MLSFRKYYCARQYTRNAFLILIILSIRAVYAVEIVSDEPVNCRLFDKSNNDYRRIVLVCQSFTDPNEIHLYANNVNLDSSDCLARAERKGSGYEKRFECGTYSPGQYKCKCGVYTSNTININPPNVIAPKGNAPLDPNDKMTGDYTDSPGSSTTFNSSGHRPMPIIYTQHAPEKVLYIVAAVFGILLLVVPIMWFVFRRRFRKEGYNAGVVVQGGNGKVELHRMKK